MGAALNFVLFLHVGAEKPTVDDEPGFTGDEKFDCGAAMSAIAAVYDRGVNTLVWDVIKGED